VSLALVAGAARAGSPGGEVRVAWPDLVRLVEQHPRLAAEQARLRAVRAGVQVAGEVPNPSLETSVAYERAREGGASGVEWELGLRVPLGWAAGRAPRQRAAEAEGQVAEAEGRALRTEVLLELGTLFWQLGHAQAQVAALTEIMAQTEALSSTVAHRVRQGEARPVEATRVEIEVERIANELEAARGALLGRRDQLGLWLGLEPGQALVVEADLDALPQGLDAAAARARVRAHHPALLAAQARARARDAELDGARLARVPGIDMTAFTAHDLERRAYGAGLSLELPLWNWNSGRIEQAEAELGAARLEEQATLRALEEAAIQAQADCQSALQSARRYQERILPRAESAAAVTEKTYQLGEAALLEVLDARRVLLETRRLSLDALAQAHTACGRLSAVIGEELP
jgi:outer membrane protein, heavy metal efflux system